MTSLFMFIILLFGVTNSCSVRKYKNSLKGVDASYEEFISKVSVILEEEKVSPDEYLLNLQTRLRDEIPDLKKIDSMENEDLVVYFDELLDFAVESLEDQNRDFRSLYDMFCELNKEETRKKYFGRDLIISRLDDLVLFKYFILKDNFDDNWEMLFFEELYPIFISNSKSNILPYLEEHILEERMYDEKLLHEFLKKFSNKANLDTSFNASFTKDVKNKEDRVIKIYRKITDGENIDYKIRTFKEEAEEWIELQGQNSFVALKDGASLNAFLRKYLKQDLETIRQLVKDRKLSVVKEMLLEKKQEIERKQEGEIIDSDRNLLTAINNEIDGARSYQTDLKSYLYMSSYRSMALFIAIEQLFKEENKFMISKEEIIKASSGVKGAITKMQKDLLEIEATFDSATGIDGVYTLLSNIVYNKIRFVLSKGDVK